LTVALGDGDPAPDEIELRLSPGADGTTLLEFEHATTFDTHEIGGQIYDAVYCMGGGYGPRLLSLDRHLRGALPADLDPRCCTCDRSSGRRSSEVWRSSRSSSKPTSTANDRCARCPDAA